MPVPREVDKTSFGPWWLARCIQEGGQGDYLAVTTSIDAFKLKMLPEIRMVYEHLLQKGRYWASERIVELKDPTTGKFWASGPSDLMWGRIILRSTQSGGGLEASTAKAAWLDECGMDGFRLYDWEAVQRRLSLSQGRVLGTTTLYNRGWVKTEAYDRWKAGDKNHDVIQFDSISNPAFPQEEYDRILATLPEWKIKMFYRGLFDNPPGLIYDVFRQELHRVQAFPIPVEWPIIVGVDPLGSVICALFIAFDRDKQQLHVFDEYYEFYGKTTREHVEALKQKCHGRRIIAFVGGGPSERQARLDWTAAGISLLSPSVWSVESGIDNVYGLFKTMGLIVHSSCRYTLAELGTYSRKVDKDGVVTEAIADKDNFHCLVGNTRVRMDKGWALLKDIRAGELVLTRRGYRRVRAQACTNSAAKVYNVLLSNGITLTGTGEHPVYVKSKGYTDLSALRYGDVTLPASAQDTQRLPVYVRHVRAADGLQPVYNLDVEQEHEYFANGILSHNCLDSARYAISWLTNPGAVGAQILHMPLKIGRL